LENKENMQSKTKKTAIVISTFAVVLVIFFCYYFITHDTDHRSVFIKIQEALGKNTSADSFSDQLVKELQKYYSKTISDKSTQASLIGIRDFVISTFPTKGKVLFYNILKRAFPDYADEIMKTLDKLDQYNRWLEDNKTVHSKMDMEKKKRELFGEDADKIWSGDMLATEVRKAKMQDVMAVLNKSSDMTLDAKLNLYRNTLNDTYKGTPEEFFLDHKEMLSKAFFSIDSVQEELKQMNSEERQLEINDIRRKMGFDGHEIEEMAEIDAKHEQRWNIGLEYMQERNDIVENFKGPQQKEQLKALREKYFQDEANTIEREEENDNFFRFERPHIYGRN
jgi:hypothetical protein